MNRDECALIVWYVVEKCFYKFPIVIQRSRCCPFLEECNYGYNFSEIPASFRRSSKEFNEYDINKCIGDIIFRLFV
ncbi:hypothetical protein CANARDRAFT_175222 [[Candida] arabinofermentans NRRL YB-2248]|uniref:Uncharacterized protein n=1 Tax=[Candida] arabinofermentans NRRL YB-2248 TaxID=983967 RepID=A0A1E4T3H5_9ASCO|nr:hypothetical protein CANARDRAFT_175222 [[Candida] arabinofermentans NRRL YB-2248]